MDNTKSEEELLEEVTKIANGGDVGGMSSIMGALGGGLGQSEQDSEALFKNPVIGKYVLEIDSLIVEVFKDGILEGIKRVRESFEKFKGQDVTYDDIMEALNEFLANEDLKKEAMAYGMSEDAMRDLLDDDD